MNRGLPLAADVGRLAPAVRPVRKLGWLKEVVCRTGRISLSFIADGVGSSSRRRVDESQLTIRQIPRYRRKLCLHIEAVFVTANDPKYDIRTPDMSAERGPMLTIRFD